MFYGPLQGTTDPTSSTLTAEEVILLRSYVTKTGEDAKLNNRAVSESKALRTGWRSTQNREKRNRRATSQPPR